MTVRQRYAFLAVLVLGGTAIGLVFAEVMSFTYAAFEVGAQQGWPHPAQLRAARDQHLPHDDRPTYQVLDDALRDGVRLVPVVPPSSYFQDPERSSFLGELQPLSGIANVRTLWCNETGTYREFVSDEFGFNNPPGLWQEPADVATVGDSFTQGECVPSDKVIAADLRRRFPKTLNLGQNGDGPLIELATLVEYGKALRPKHVVWFFYEGNDLDNILDEFPNPIFKHYLDDRDFSQGLMQKQRVIDQELDALWRARLDKTLAQRARWIDGASIEWARANWTGVPKLRDLRQRLGLAPPAFATARTYGQTYVTLKRVLATAKTIVAGWGGDVVFVYLPEYQTLARPPHKGLHHDRVLEVVAEDGLPVIDMTSVMARDADPLHYFPFRLAGGHYTEAGYQLVADQVLSRLASQP